MILNQKYTINSSDDINKYIENKHFSPTEFEAKILNFLSQWFNDQEFILINTSGSTGNPKTIKLLKSDMTASAHQTIRYFDLKAGNQLFLCLPIDFIAGKMMIVRALELNAHLLVSEPSSRPFQHISNKIDFTAITPMQLRESILDLKKVTIKKMLVGGAKTENDLVQLIQTIDTEIYESYGMTETCSHIALKKLNGPGKSRYFSPLDNVKIEIDALQRLIIYPEFLSVNQIITNDIANILPDGSFEILGRLDDVINSGGIKIFPNEMEVHISSVIHEPFIISALPDKVFGERLVIVLKSALTEHDQESLLQKIRAEKNLKIYPKEFRFIDSFPVLPSGKIDRKMVKRMIQGDAETS